MKRREANPPPRLLNTQEAAEYIGVAESTLYKWVGQRRITHVKMGSLVRFDRRHLDQLITEQTVMPMPPRPLDKR